MSLQTPAHGSNSTSRHECHCGKGFARKEHLTRHQATHDRPAYTCNICQRQFSRNDLLRRHSTVHEASHTRVVVSCDACRVNKSKCSGGIPCLLCARRGINCTFRSSLRPSQREWINDGLAALNTSFDEGGNGNAELMPLTNLKPENSIAEHTPRAETELLPPTIQFLQNLTIVPSKPRTTAESQVQCCGMKALYESLIAEKSSLEEAMQESNESQEWVTTYLEIYFKTFHLQWPILHAPTFGMEISTVSLPLAASMCVIGAWFQSSADWTERFYALRVHEVLLQRLLHSVIDHESVVEGKAWPIELFQAALLTLVFSLHRTNKSALSRAMLLRSAFLTLLRDIGAFNAELLTKQLAIHFSGTYAPYALSIREKFKRLLALSYQFDAYFALTQEQPPILHRQEIRVSLPSTFALWNTYGLDTFAIRQPEEPPRRSELPLSEMLKHPHSFTPSPLLVEDVQLGLCGLLQAIWTLSRSFPCTTRGYFDDTVLTVLLIKTLEEWKHELDKINRLANAQNFTFDTARYLLLAYRGDDDSATASLDRLTTLLRDATVFYYYLRMYHYVGQNTSGVVGLVKQLEDPRTDTWRTSQYGREALVCALQILMIVESNARVFFDPLKRYALALGIAVTKVVVSGLNCECLTRKDECGGNTDLERWPEEGGPLWINGTAVCTCKLRFWSQRFERSIQEQMVRVEQADSTETS